MQDKKETKKTKDSFSKDDVINAYKEGFLSTVQSWCGEYPFDVPDRPVSIKKENEKQLNQQAENWFNEKLKNGSMKLINHKLRIKH